MPRQSYTTRLPYIHANFPSLIGVASHITRGKTVRVVVMVTVIVRSICIQGKLQSHLKSLGNHKAPPEVHMGYQPPRNLLPKACPQDSRDEHSLHRNWHFSAR